MAECTILQELQERDVAKVARMRLLGEDQIYIGEYAACVKRIQLRNELLERRALRRASYTKSKA